MGRIIAIDYGTKRVGLAVTDPLQIIATGLATVGEPDAITYLKEYASREKIEGFVVGEPRNLDGTPAESAPRTDDFIKKLSAAFPLIPVSRMDERFTSRIAFRTMVDAGLKKKDRRNKALIDTVSAVLILQSWLESRKMKND